jgi:hypothetical protein
MAAVLDDVWSQSTAVLVPEATFANIRAFCLAWPPVFSTSYLEVRLSASARADNVDFFLALTERECSAFMAALATNATCPSGVSEAGWQGMLAFCEHWLQARARLTALAHVSSLFFEFDRPHVTQTRSPGTFLRLRNKPDAHALLRSLTLLRSGEDSASAHDALEACLAAIAPHGKLMHLGVMARSAARDLRLHVTVPRTSVRPILAQLFPQAGLHESDQLQVLAIGPDWVDLQLQIAQELVPSVGIEVSFSGQPPHDPRWQAWLAPLLARGECSQPKLEALLAWPAHLPSGVHCELSHLKVTVAQGTALGPKAYLGIWQPTAAA